MSEVPGVSSEELASIRTHKETEGPELDIAGLARQTTDRIQARRVALQELPPAFNQRLKSEIIRYITNSPGRFESDENAGLSAKEFENFRSSMLSKVQGLIEQYAPTEAEIAAKKEAMAKMEKVKKAAKIEDVKLDDIQEDPGPITDLPTLAQRYETFEGWNGSLQNQGNKIMETTSNFQKTFQEFAQARQGLHAYKKFVDYFAGGDSETQELEAKKASMERDLEATRKKLENAQKKLDRYAEKIGKASNEQKQEKIKARDAHLKRIDENEKLSKEEKEARKAEYLRLKGQRESLSKQRQDLSDYAEQVRATRDGKITDQIQYAETRRDQLGNYGNIMRNAQKEIDGLLENPDLNEAQRKELEKTRRQIEDQETHCTLAEIGAQSVLEKNTEQWKMLNEEDQRIGQQTYVIDTHITNDLIPTINTLDQHIGLLTNAMIQYTDSKEEVMKHYAESFRIYDNIDEAVDSAVLAHSLANTQMIGNIDYQLGNLRNMKIEKPSGFIGFFESTIGVGLSTVGAGVSSAGEWMIQQSVDLDHELSLAKENGWGPVKYWSAKIALEIVSAPIGVAGGLTEMGGGLITMIGQPINTVSGLGSLIGRNPATGEWSWETAGTTWKSLGLAMIQYEHFSNGRIGVGIGKIFPDIVFTLTGAGALAKGGKAAKVAYMTARAEGKDAITAIRTGASEMFKVTGAEIAVSAKEAIQTPGKMISFAQETMTGIGDDLASRSRLAQRIFGEKAALRGLGRREEKLLTEIAEGAEDYAKFQKRLSQLQEENPDLSDVQIRQKILQEDPKLFRSAERVERKITQTLEMRARLEGDFHMELDNMTGMRQKQLLYTPEGIKFLQQRFGEEVSMTFSDVTGMGIGNKYLKGPSETLAEARNTVDTSFKLMKEVADEVFGNKPFEIVRFGGDEIVFLTRKGDKTLMAEFFKRFNARKKEFLIEKIGKKAYETAKRETNIKAQQKLITKDKGYQEAYKQGREALRQWFKDQLENYPDHQTELDDMPTQDMFRALAEQRLPDEAQWLEPLDFYRAPARDIPLVGHTPEEARAGLMDDVAKADNDIAWQKAHPGQQIPEGRTYSEEVAKTGTKYLEEAEETSRFSKKIKDLQDQLKVAENLGNKEDVARLQKEIIRIRTRDPGTGAIRLDKAREYQINELIRIPDGTTELHITRMDLPYFGVFNNHYDYATADTMMRELSQTLTEAFGTKCAIIRDGGNLLVATPHAPKGIDRAALKEALDLQVEKYASPPNSKGVRTTIDRRSAMRQEVEVKQATTGTTDTFGRVKLYESQPVSINDTTTLWEATNPVL